MADYQRITRTNALPLGASACRVCPIRVSTRLRGDRRATRECETQWPSSLESIGMERRPLIFNEQHHPIGKTAVCLSRPKSVANLSTDGRVLRRTHRRSCPAMSLPFLLPKPKTTDSDGSPAYKPKFQHSVAPLSIVGCVGSHSSSVSCFFLRSPFSLFLSFSLFISIPLLRQSGMGNPQI